ncbi:hypothetical protein MRX96_032117 [Rhipicephalus microplus]
MNEAFDETQLVAEEMLEAGRHVRGILHALNMMLDDALGRAVDLDAESLDGIKPQERCVFVGDEENDAGPL